MPKKEIKFTIELDEKNMPQSIEWEATDAGFNGKKPCNSMMIQLWDKDAQNSMHIDLWTQDMMVQHMNVHVFHNLMNIAGVYRRATGNAELAGMIQQFAQQFANQIKK